jgi:hypothetical protein
MLTLEGMRIKIAKLDKLVKHLLSNSSSSSYQAYIATLAQSSTGDPIATVLNSGDANFISGIEPERSGVGDYALVKIGAFPVGKTWIMIGQGAPTSNLGIINCYRINDNSIGISFTKFDGTTTDNFVDVAVEIRVYP